VIIALVASLETLLNLEAIDRLDPWRRSSPPNRELLAQGIGNVACGLLGGIPVTSVIVRSSVNLNAGGRTKLVTIFHGMMMLGFVLFLPVYLNLIPLSCLAAILLVTGFKLASPQLIRKMWTDGRYQFIPFIVTVVAIVLTDLLIGILVGLGVSLGFILNSNFRRPTRRVLEKHLGGEVLHIQLANQVSFLNRAALSKILDEVPRGGHVLLNASSTDYIDPDVLEMIRDFSDKSAPARGLQVSLRGFRDKYQLEDRIQYVDYSTRELQASLTPEQALQILKDGHQRFRFGQRLTRDLGRQINATATGQHPFAVILGCIDSRIPAEIVFDLGVGDIFSVRVAGNTTSPKVLGSLEYACAVVGAKLIVVMGHTRCGAVTAAVKFAGEIHSVEQVTGCQHLKPVLQDVQQSIDPDSLSRWNNLTELQQVEFVDDVARANVARTVETILQESRMLSRLVRDGKIAIVGAMYDVVTGDILFMEVDRTDERERIATNLNMSSCS
jgi:carbonic anhydrase/SulP family sulfate permease